MKEQRTQSEQSIKIISELQPDPISTDPSPAPKNTDDKEKLSVINEESDEIEEGVKSEISMNTRKKQSRTRMTLGLSDLDATAYEIQLKDIEESSSAVKQHIINTSLVVGTESEMVVPDIPHH